MAGGWATFIGDDHVAPLPWVNVGEIGRHGQHLVHGESVAAAERLRQCRPAFHAGPCRAFHQQPGRVNQAQIQGQADGLKVVQQR